MLAAIPEEFLSQSFGPTAFQWSPARNSKDLGWLITLRRHQPSKIFYRLENPGTGFRKFPKLALRQA
jgi:hypothetical protein